MSVLVFTVGALFFMYLGKRYHSLRGERRRRRAKPIPEAWRRILEKHVIFYGRLPWRKKQEFERRVMCFLEGKDFIAKDTKVKDLDKVLVASSAVIPLFGFPEWNFPELEEIVIFPDRFCQDIDKSAPDKRLIGMVGTGDLKGKMFLSKKALRRGYMKPGSGVNVGIHEFIHLIDLADREMDGVPEMLMPEGLASGWMEKMLEEVKRIRRGRSDLREYAGSGPVEFFTVAGEYFFDSPYKMKQEHPDLYRALARLFNQDLAVT